MSQPHASRHRATASRISVAESACTLSTHGNRSRWTTVTSAPRRNASSASSRPIAPLDRVVSTRTSSTFSRQGPLVISTFFPASGRPATARSHASTISSVPAIFALPSAITGSTSTIPHDFSFARFSITAGCRYMLWCMAGMMITGFLLPSAVVAKVVTGVSSIPHAIFPMVFAVQGAISRRSALPPSPQSPTCSTRPVIRVIAGSPEAYASASGATIPQAAALITTLTFAPRRRSAWITFTISTAAMLPVTPTTISFPASVCLIGSRCPARYATCAGHTSSPYVRQGQQKNLLPKRLTGSPPRHSRGCAGG